MDKQNRVPISFRMTATRAILFLTIFRNKGLIKRWQTVSSNTGQISKHASKYATIKDVSFLHHILINLQLIELSVSSSNLTGTRSVY